MEFSPYQIDDRLFFVACAILANLIILGHPLIQKLFGTNRPERLLHWSLRIFERKLNRPNRSAGERRVRGAVMIIGMVGLCGIIASAISGLTAAHHLTWLVEVAILGLFLPVRQLYQRAESWVAQVKQKKLSEARKTIQKCCLRETSKMDGPALYRATIEYLAKGFADRIFAPILWYVLLGLPGFIGCRILTEAALLTGYPSKRHKHFGKTSAVFEKLVNAVPAYLSSFLLVLAATFTPSANPVKGLATMSKDAGKIHSPQKGYPLAVAAGSLGISLGGARNVQGFLVKDGWVGTGTAKISAAQVKKFLWQYVIACLLILALIATLLLI